MDKVPEWITAIGTLLTAGGVLFLRSQLALMKIQISADLADHERVRRENAINYLFEWSKGLLRTSSLARRLAEDFDETQTRALAGEEELTIDKKYKDLVLGVLSGGPKVVLTEKADGITLDKSQVADIRWQLVRYLNILESFFVAARHGVADKRILVEQFAYLYNQRKGHFVLKEFRDAMGGAEAYPSLDDLEKELKRKRTPAEGLPPIGVTVYR